MRDEDQSPISVRDAKHLFADWKIAPALVLAVSGGPDSIALMWLMARWRRAMRRGPRLIAVTVDHGLRTEAAPPARHQPHQRDGIGPAGHRENERGSGLPVCEQAFRLACRDRGIIVVGHGGAG